VDAYVKAFVTQYSGGIEGCAKKVDVAWFGGKSYEAAKIAGAEASGSISLFSHGMLS